MVAGDVATIDPSADDLFPTYSELAYDGLTATRFTGGSAGTQIVPDLALSLPAPADSATTYTFRLRPDIRYSDGEAMQPSDFRLGLERLLLLNPDLAGNFSHVIGAARCTAPPACDLSSGVIVSGSSTVTFHLTGPDPRFLEELTVLIPTPQGTLLTDAGTTPVPGTGPYTIADFAPGRLLTFERNPYFTAWAPSRPDGYPEEIDLVMGLSGQDAAAKVAAGQVDIDEEVSEAPAARQLALAHPGQVHTEDDQAIVAVFLNTTLPPFNDIRVRRALNFAVDRQHIVGVFGVALAEPTCQILAPTTTGYRPYCPYTIDPSSDGQWRAPDLATARSLVTASGTAGQDVTLWAFPDFADAGEEVADTLDSLGYHASVHEIGRRRGAISQRWTRRPASRPASSGGTAIHWPSTPSPPSPVASRRTARSSAIPESMPRSITSPASSPSTRTGRSIWQRASTGRSPTWPRGCHCSIRSHWC